MKRKLLVLFGIFIIGITTPVMAQFGPDAPPPGAENGPDAPPPGFEEGPDPPPAAPINKYIILLTVSGLAVGYKKTINKNNQ